MSNKKIILFAITLVILLIGVTAVNAGEITNKTITKDSTPTIKTNKIIKDTSTYKVNKDNKKTGTIANTTKKTLNKDKVQTKSVKKEPGTHVINTDTFSDYFDSEGNMSNTIKNGDVLDFQGKIYRNQSMTISVPVNITSSTKDALISLNTTAEGFDGKNLGNSFVINNESSYTNITGISFFNTQFVIRNASHVTVNNVTANVTNQKIGAGVGHFTAREYCEYITIENSKFITDNNQGHSTLVFSGVKHSTIRNNTVIGIGNIGNLIYLNTYNLDGVDVENAAMLNVNNTIEDNYLDGTDTVVQSICYGITIAGTNNTIRNNTIKYSGVGITTAMVDSDKSQSIGTKIIGNTLIGGCNINTPDNGEVINNTAYKLSITMPNSIIESNNFENVIVSVKDIVLDNHTITGNLTFSGKSSNVTVKNSNITNITIYGTDSGSKREDIKIFNSTIGYLIIGQTDAGSRLDRANGYVTNLEVNENNITEGVFIVGRYNENINIINNKIITNNNYAINLTVTKLEGLSIKNNELRSKSGNGVNSIKTISNSYYSMFEEGIEGNTPEEERIIVLQNTTININTTQFDINKEATIIAIVLSGNNKVSDGDVVFKYANGTVIGTKPVYSGESKLKITFTKAGIETITATYLENEDYNSSTTTAAIKINKVSTTTKVNSVTTKINDTVTITATVTNSLNTTTEGNVLFKDASGKVLSTVKLVNGVATYKTTFKTAGTQKISAVYSETDYYKSSSATSTITVNKLNTKVSIDSVNGKVNDYVTVSVKVFDANSKAVSEGEVSLKLNGVLLKDSKGNVVKFAVKNGVASGKVLADSSWMKSGVKLTASYLGSANYVSSSGVTSSVKVVKHTAVLTTTVTSSAVGGDTITIKSKVVEGKTLLNKGKVTFKFNGKVIGTVTVKNGVATLKYKIPKGTVAKKYNVVTSFSHSDFNTVSKTNGVIVKKSAVKVKASKVTAKSKAVLKAKIVDKFGKNVVGTSKVTIKVDSKKVKTVTAKKGVIKVTISTSKLKKGKHKVTYIIAANKSYDAGKATVVLTKK